MFGSVKINDLKLIPNLISILRIILTPIVFYFLSVKDSTLIVSLLFIAIVLTDFLDGYLSRLLNMGSDLGKLLDPLADKIAIVGVALGLVIYMGFPLWYLIVLAIRDLMLVIGGSWLYKNRGIVVMANFWGKATTTSLGALAGTYILRDVLPVDLTQLGLWVSIGFLSIATFIYIRDFIVNLKKSNQG